MDKRSSGQLWMTVSAITAPDLPRHYHLVVAPIANIKHNVVDVRVV